MKLPTLKFVAASFSCVVLGSVLLAQTATSSGVYIADGAVLAAEQAAADYEASAMYQWQNRSREISEMREGTEKSFNILDEDENGTISLDEILFEYPPQNESEEQPNWASEEMQLLSQRYMLVQTIFNRWEEDVDRYDVADTNKDGMVDREEFDAQHVSLRHHMLEIGFNELDTNGSGSVELVEYSAHLDIAQEYDENGDGSLSQAEISKIEDLAVMRRLSQELWQSWDQNWHYLPTAEGADSTTTNQ